MKTASELFGLCLGFLVLWTAVLVGLRRGVINKFLNNYRLLEVRKDGVGITWCIEQQRKGGKWCPLYRSSDYDLMKNTYEAMTSPLIPGKGEEKIIIAEDHLPINHHNGRSKKPTNQKEE